LPTLLYFLFFLNALFVNSILASRTNGTTCPDLAGFAFAATHKTNAMAKAKEPLLANALMGNRILESYLSK